jgi:hypothetical protein
MFRAALAKSICGGYVAFLVQSHIPMTFRLSTHRFSLFACLIALAPLLAGPITAQAQEHKVAVASFGLFGGQDVFRNEATGAAAIIAQRFGADPVVVRFNSRRTADATIPALAASLEGTAKAMDPARDVLILILTSHGSPDGLAVTAGHKDATLTPARLAAMVERTGVRRKAVIISACYSGVFIPRLANADTLVITAADAHHPSFGCEDRAKWTYFGDAFFNAALRAASTLREAFTRARAIVLERERHNGFEHSNPQIAGGANVEPLLIARTP